MTPNEANYFILGKISNGIIKGGGSTTYVEVDSFYPVTENILIDSLSAFSDESEYHSYTLVATSPWT